MLTSLQVIILSCLARGSSTEDELCPHIEKMESRYFSDFLIVGMYPVRASIPSRYNYGAFMRMEATRFAIHQGNTLLRKQGIPLRMGYIFYDSCNRISTATNSALDFLLKIDPESTQANTKSPTCPCAAEFSKKIIGVVGTASSGTAMHLTGYLEAEEIPIISYGATSTALSDKRQYPLFRRTVPPDNFLAKLIVDVILKFNWTYVTLIHTDDTYGRTGRDALYQLFRFHNVCTSAVHSYPYPLDGANKADIVMSLRARHLSRVVVLWLDTAGAESVLTAASQHEIFGKTWILTEAVARSPRILDLDPRIVHGLLTVAPFGGHYAEFEDYFWGLSWRDIPDNPWLAALFQSIRGANYNATGDALKNYGRFVNTEKSAFPRNAVFAYVHALKNYYAEGLVNITAFSNPKKRLFNRTMFNDRYIKQVAFEGLAGETFGFDKNGDPINVVYHVHAVQAKRNGPLAYSKVAEWSMQHGLKWLAEMVWSGNTSKPTVSSCAATCSAGYYSIMDGQTSCCWSCNACPANTFKLRSGNHDCEACPVNTFPNARRTACKELGRAHARVASPIGIFIIIESTVVMTIISAHLVTLVVHRHTPVARSTNLPFALTQLGSQLLLSATLFQFFAPATTTSCIFKLATLATFPTVALAIILAKTEQILQIFHTHGKVSRKSRLISKSMQACTVVLLTTAQWCIVATTLLVHPVRLLTQLDTERGKRVVVCNVNVQLFAAVVYDILLCAACAVQAFRARNLPANFNEARSIVYATFASCVLLATLIPLYSSIKNHASKTLALATLLSLTNLALVFMYSQRVRVILLQPELNDARSTKMGYVIYCMAEIDGEIRTRCQRLASPSENTSMKEQKF